MQEDHPLAVLSRDYVVAKSGSFGMYLDREAIERHGGEVPASKSATNRALVLAALSEVPVLLVNPLDSDDTRALLRCLAAMGARVAKREDGISVSGPLGISDGRLTVLDAEPVSGAALWV